MLKPSLSKFCLLACLIAGLAMPSISFAAPGDLIPTFGAGGVVISNPSSGNEAPSAIGLDASGIYIVGNDQPLDLSNTRWRIEKRDLTTGTLIPAFGAGGVVISNPSSGNEAPSAIGLDASGIYIVGNDRSPGLSNTQWRIEKRDATTGALIAAFGSGGVITSNPSPNSDEAEAVAVDGTGVYVVGADYSLVTERIWRIEKRDQTTGALIAAFGSGGVVLSNPPDTYDSAFAIAIDASGMYVAGSQDYYRVWRIEKRDLTTGALIPSFGAGGVVTSDPSPSFFDQARAISINATGIYVTGYANEAWRIEKRDLTTGALIASFGSGGVVIQSLPTDATASNIVANASGLYVAGTRKTGVDSEMRIEKRDLTTGALIPSFGAGGAVTSDPTPGYDTTNAIAIDGMGIYIGGTQNGGGSDSQWRIEKRESGGGGGGGGPFVDCGVFVQTSSGPVALSCEPSGPPTSQLRIYKNSEWRGLGLVPLGDSNASKVRIRTSTGVRALRKQ